MAIDSVSEYGKDLPDLPDPEEISAEEFSGLGPTPELPPEPAFADVSFLDSNAYLS